MFSSTNFLSLDERSRKGDGFLLASCNEPEHQSDAFGPMDRPLLKILAHWERYD